MFRQPPSLATQQHFFSKLVCPLVAVLGYYQQTTRWSTATCWLPFQWRTVSRWRFHLRLHDRVLSPSETGIRQVLQPSDFCAQSQEVWDPTFQAEESAEYKDVAVAALLPQGLFFWPSNTRDVISPQTGVGLQRVTHRCACCSRRDEGRSALLTSLSPPSSCWRFPFHSLFVHRSVISARTKSDPLPENRLINPVLISSCLVKLPEGCENLGTIWLYYLSGVNLAALR